MLVATISDAKLFLDKARAVGAEIRVQPGQTVTPVKIASKRVVMRPALVLNYSFTFSSPVEGFLMWTYQEVVATDASGRANLKDTLWEKLKNGAADIKFTVNRGP